LNYFKRSSRLIRDTRKFWNSGFRESIGSGIRDKTEPDTYTDWKTWQSSITLVSADISSALLKADFEFSSGNVEASCTERV